MATDREYLRQVLQLDPQYDARRIVALRAAHRAGLPLPPRDDDAEEGLAARRREMLRALERIRRAFWAADERRLAEELAALDARAFPEMQPEVVRLRRAATVRGELESFAGERGQAANFVQLLRDICVASPREAATLREAALSALRSASTPAERRLRRDCRRIARRAVRTCPTLSEFEGAWLADAIAARGTWRDSWRRIAGPLAFAFLVALWLVWLLEIVSLRLLRGLL